MPSFFNKLTLSPKRLFLIDGFGALLTGFILFAILRTFNKYFGMPLHALNFLSIIAFIYSAYSFCCFFLFRNNWQPFLRAIIIANLLYCILTLGLVIYNFRQLTILAVIYFLLEIVVICILVFFEIKGLNESYQKRHSGN
jgi:hypothetical protein